MIKKCSIFFLYYIRLNNNNFLHILFLFSFFFHKTCNCIFHLPMITRINRKYKKKMHIIIVRKIYTIELRDINMNFNNLNFSSSCGEI